MKTYHQGTKDWSCYIEPNGKGFDVSWVYGTSLTATPSKYYSWEDLEEILMLRGIDDVDFYELRGSNPYMIPGTKQDTLHKGSIVSRPKKCCGNCKTIPMSEEELEERKKLKEGFMNGISDGYHIDKTALPQNNSTTTTKLSNIDIKFNDGVSVFWNGQEWIRTELRDYKFDTSTYTKLSNGEEKPMEFQVGDIVDWHGAEGIVNSITNLDPHCVRVHFYYGTIGTFTIDGKFHEKHTSPSITLKSRPKKKVMKTFYVGIKKVESDVHEFIPSDVVSDKSLLSEKAYTILTFEMEVEDNK